MFVLLLALLSAWSGLTHARTVGDQDAAKSSITKSSQRGVKQRAKPTVSRHARVATQSKVAGRSDRQGKASKRKVSQRKVSKRKVSKRKVSKRKVSQRKASKRKASKRKVSKRKVSKRKVSKRKVSKRKVTRAKRRKSPRRAGRRGARPTLAHAFGLHQAPNPLALFSSVALVIDPRDNRILYNKNGGHVLPIASITKLMAAMVIIDAKQSAKKMLEITRADIDRIRRSSSRLGIGTRLSRAEMLQLALMSSENRAANALGRHYPGGLPAFVSAMNAKAQLIGMYDTRFSDPSGLSGANMSTAADLAVLVSAASQYPKIKRYSTATSLRVDTGYRQLTFRTTNALINTKGWDIGLQKTGYIAEAGRCMVIQTKIDGKPVVMVLLDSRGRFGRFADAKRIKRWLQRQDRRAATSVATVGAG